MTPKLALTAGADGVGFLVGPLLNFFFIGVDIRIGSWHLNYYNAAVGFLAIVYLFLIIADIFLLTDVSKERDFTDSIEDVVLQTITHEKNSDQDFSGVSGEEDDSLLSNTDDTSRNEYKNNKQEDINPERWNIGTYFDVLLICAITFLSAFCPYMEDIWASLLMIDVQGFSINEMNIFFLVCAISSILTMFVFMRYQFTSKTLFFLAMVWLVFLLIQQNATALLRIYTLPYWLAMLVWGIIGVATTQIVSLEYYFLVDLMPKMITHSRLSYWSSLRWSLYMVGCLLASVAGPYLFLVLEYQVLVANAVTIAVMVGMVIRRDSFINPSIVF